MKISYSGFLSALIGAWAFLTQIDHIFILQFGMFGPSHAFSLALFLAFASDKLKTGLNKRAVYTALFATSLCLVLGSVFSLDPTQSLRRTVLVGYYFILVALAVWALSKKQTNPSILVLCFSLGAISAAIYGMANDYTWSGRLTSFPSYNPTWLGANLAASAGASFLLAYNSQSAIHRWTFIAILTVAAYCLLLTQSQTATFALAIMLTYTVLRGALIRPSFILALLLGVSLTYYAFLPELNTEALDRYARTARSAEVGLDVSTSGRTAIWRQYLQMDNLSLTGVGAMQAMEVRAASTMTHSPHNTYILVLIEYGLIGLIALACSLALVGRKARLTVSGQSGFVFMVFFMVGNDMLYYKYAWIAASGFIAAHYFELATNFRSSRKGKASIKPLDSGFKVRTSGHP